MIVLANDDGIDAPGIAALARAAESLGAGERIITVAPHQAMSECSHCVTTKKPLLLDRRGENAWAVHGTPADCARVAILHLAEKLGEPVRLVLSGINNGGNLGADVYISGTLAAAREAAFFEVPAIALSQYRRMHSEIDWERTARWARRVLANLRGKAHQTGTLWNVNFPDPEKPVDEPAMVMCEKSTRPLPVKYDHGDLGLQYVTGRYHQRAYEPGSDIAVCFGGNISASLLRL